MSLIPNDQVHLPLPLPRFEVMAALLSNVILAVFGKEFSNIHVALKLVAGKLPSPVNQGIWGRGVLKNLLLYGHTCLISACCRKFALGIKGADLATQKTSVGC